MPRFAEEGSDEEEDSDECAASTPQPTAAEMAQRAGATVIDLEAEMAPLDRAFVCFWRTRETPSRARARD